MPGLPARACCAQKRTHLPARSTLCAPVSACACLSALAGKSAARPATIPTHLRIGVPLGRSGRQSYALRSGVEATISQAVRRLPLRQSRYRGMPKVQLQEVVTATALNCLRLYAYVNGVPRGTTWMSHLARLQRRGEQEPAQPAVA